MGSFRFFLLCELFLCFVCFLSSVGNVFLWDKFGIFGIRGGFSFVVGLVESKMIEIDLIVMIIVDG